MATLANNLLTKGISGTFGKTIVFKQWRNKTIIANYSVPTKKQSETQKANRTKFRDAAKWAKATLKDPERKAYYQKKAQKLGLPNAYTAAITDYMRKPLVEKSSPRNGTTTFFVKKKGFTIAKTQVTLTSANGSRETRTVLANSMGECMIVLNDSDLHKNIRWLVTDAKNSSMEIVSV